jgi:type I restriction enzyme S subunit
MFGDPIENEKGWEVKKWKELFDTRLGKMLDKSKQVETDKKYKYLANANVKWGEFDLHSLSEMTFTEKESEEFKLLKGDLLICEGGEAGRCAIWQIDNSDIKFQKAIHRARVKNNIVDTIFVLYYMLFFRKDGGLKDYVTKATIEHLTGVKLNMVPVVLPPLPLQQEFAKRIELIEQQKAQISSTIKDLETLLASRMQYWFD